MSMLSDVYEDDWGDENDQKRGGLPRIPEEISRFLILN